MRTSCPRPGRGSAAPARLGGAALRRRARALARDEGGAAMVEFALTGAMLLVMVLGVVEFGNVYSAVHTLTSLSREGANLAARGSTLQQALDNVLANGSEMALASRGGAVVSRIAVRDGSATVDAQVASPGYANKSQLGSAGGPAADAEPWGMQDGQTVYAVEIFYRYEAITPFDRIAGFGVPDTLYERGIF